MRLAYAGKLADWVRGRGVLKGWRTVDERAWHPGDIYKAWGEIHRSLHDAMKRLPRESLQFFAFRASDGIIRQAASEVLDWLENRDTLPDWGWFGAQTEERLRRGRDQVCGVGAGSGIREEASSDCNLGSWSSSMGNRTARRLDEPVASAL